MQRLCACICEMHCMTLHCAKCSDVAACAGGQKVKVVIAAAMWNNPHILVLDEPTNYLDRDSLGALAGAIREYGGGVSTIISGILLRLFICCAVRAL